jgi:hypothetical protein
MKPQNQRLALLMLFVASLICAGVFFVRNMSNAPRLSPTEAARLLPLLDGVGKATLVLYEGLPHQSLEHKSFQQELASRETIRVNEYPFYARPLSVKPGDIEPLRQLSKTASNFATVKYAKACGGFHPDYCLEWTLNNTTCRYLVCLGCAEVEIHGTSESLFLEMCDGSYGRWKSVLYKYRSQRPKTPGEQN